MFFIDLYKIFIREIKAIIKDTNLLTVFLVAPLAYPLLYGAVYMNKIEEKLPVVVVDEDNSSLSRSLLRDFSACQTIDITETASTIQEAKEMLINEKVQSIILIPKSFSRNLSKGKTTAVNLFVPPGRLLVLSDIGIPVSKIVSTFNAKVFANFQAKKGVPVFENKDLITPIKIDFQYLYNPYLTYGDLILPSLLMIIISQLVLIGAAAANAKEWSLNKYQDLFAITKNPLSIFFGKLFAYYVIFSTFSLAVFALCSPLYQINLGYNYTAIFIFTSLGIFSSGALGIFLGTFFRHRITVFVILGFTTYPFFMLSGYAWPQLQIPEILVCISNLLPLTPFVQSVLSITQMDNPISYIYPQLLLMSGLTILYFILSSLRYYKIRKANV